MIRRLSLAVCALVGTAVLTSCAQFDRNDVAASVNDSELSQDEFAEILDSELGAFLLNTRPVDGVITGDGARGLISAWIGLTAIDQSGLLASADRAQIESDLAAQFGDDWTSAPQLMRDLAITNVAVGNAANAGELAREDLLTVFDGADIFVDSRYGAWNVADNRVVALG